MKNSINWTYSKENNEDRVIQSKSDTIEIMVNNKRDEFIGKLFESLFYRFQIALETSLKGSDFICDYIDSLC